MSNLDETINGLKHCADDHPCCASAIESAIEQLGADRRSLATLQDPTSVWVNLLRNTIARPSVDQILHIYPQLCLKEGEHDS